MHGSRDFARLPHTVISRLLFHVSCTVILLPILCNIYYGFQTKLMSVELREMELYQMELRQCELC